MKRYKSVFNEKINLKEGKKFIYDSNYSSYDFENNYGEDPRDFLDGKVDFYDLNRIMDFIPELVKLKDNKMSDAINAILNEEYKVYYGIEFRNMRTAIHELIIYESHIDLSKDLDKYSLSREGNFEEGSFSNAKDIIEINYRHVESTPYISGEYRYYINGDTLIFIEEDIGDVYA